MNPDKQSVFNDRDLLGTLIGEPELLAIADAIVAAGNGGLVAPDRQPLTRRPWPKSSKALVAATFAALALAGALLLVGPWKQGPDLVQRALAAVGNGPVLHVSVTQPGPAAGGPLIELATGKIVSQTLQTDVWFDPQRHLKKTIYALDGRTLDQELQTDQGSWNTAGAVLTCGWIAAHPIEATRLHVSCDPSGENGSTPRSVPEPAVKLDPALRDFLDQYRSALGSGAARETGRGEVDGHKVIWLSFANAGALERVAVDARSYQPLLIEQDGGARLRVVTAETVPYTSALFARPQLMPNQKDDGLASEQVTTPASAALLLKGSALWLGESWNGLKLVSTTRQDYATEDENTAIAPDSVVIKFRYATGAGDEPQRTVDIYEAGTCLVRVGWECTPRDPSGPGILKLAGTISLLRSHGLYISMWDTSADREAHVELARALKEVGT
jgi:hypothetical protein